MGSEYVDDAGSQDDAPEIKPVRAVAGREVATVPANKSSQKLKALLGAGASLVLVIIAFFVLSRTIANINLSELSSGIAATSLGQIALGLLFTAFSYLMLTGYDAIALKQLRLKVPYRTTALGSFTSYAVSFTLGFPIFTGGTVRYWIYSRAGVKPGKIASLTVVAGVTFWLGMAVVIGLGLLVEAEPISEINQLPVWLNWFFGIAVVAAVGYYLYWVSVQPRRAKLQGFMFELPGLGLTLGQMALGVLDLCAAAAVLYVLLPSHDGLGFFTFASVYVFACLLGIVSHAPGGIGVFEATMLKALPSPSQEALLASLLMFRILYYVIPFVVALVLLGATQGGRHWDALREAMNRAVGGGDER